MTRPRARSTPPLLALAVAAALAGPAQPAAVDQPAGVASRPVARPAAGGPAAASAPASAPAPADPPALDEQFLQAQRQQRDQARAGYAALPDGGLVPLDRIARLSDDGTGMLSLDPGPRGGPLYQRFTVGGVPAAWQVTRTAPVLQTVVLPDGTIGPLVVSNATLTRVDLTSGDDADYWSVRVNHQSPTGYTSVYGQAVRGATTLTLYPARRTAPAAPGARAAFANLRAVNLTVSEWQPIAAAGGAGAGPFPGGPFGGGGFAGGGFAAARVRNAVAFRAAADSLPELRAAHVAEFRKYVVPLLRKVSDLAWLTPGASDVYAAFPSIPADPEVAARLAALLPDLGADEATVRDAAAERLMALGPAGALAALRADGAVLSVGQRGELGRLVAAHRRRDLPPADARRDLNFLLDALEYPDPAVRAAAHAALEAGVGQPLNFDPTLNGAALGQTADAVRLSVTGLLAAGGDAATRPATQP